MSDYNNLIKLLKKLNFTYKNDDVYRYDFEYYNPDNLNRYILTFNKHVSDYVHIKIFYTYEDNEYPKFNNIDNHKEALDIINSEFKHIIRKQKINKLINESITKA